jgi:uncharacterized protein (DUF1778 family)
MPAQRALIDHAATVLGKTVSEFILEAAIEHARAVACEQVFLCLDTKRFQRFAANFNTRSIPYEEVASPPFIAKAG